MDYFKFDGAEIEVVSAVNRYGTLPIRYYDDLNLSPKAWGILGKIFLLKSRNENWKISVNGLATQIKGGRDLVKSTVKELKDNGYLHTKIERKIERYKKENLSKEKENRSANSVIGKIQSQIGFQFLLQEHPEDEQLLRLISRVIAEKLLSEDASITSKNFKYSSDEVHECFGTLDFNHIEYLLECLKKNPKKEIRNMKQYLLVTLMNVQANYEGAKLNKNKSDEEEMAEEKQEEKANVAKDVVTSSVSEILKHQGQQNEMNHSDSDEADDILNQSFSKDDFMNLFGTGSSNSEAALSRSAFWEMYKKPDDSRSIADLNNGELAELTMLMQDQQLVEKLKAKA